MTEITLKRFEELANTYKGGVVYADESPHLISIGVVKEITFGNKTFRIEAPVCRYLTSNNTSAKSRCTGWTCSNDSKPFFSDGIISFDIFPSGRIQLFPPGHKLIQEYWLK